MTHAERGDGTPAIIALEEVNSTNSEAQRRAVRGERGPVWVLAQRQTAGRGRAGRAWVMTEGDLAATLLYVPGCLPQALPQLSLLAGVAVHEALAGFGRRAPAAQALRLKWPNDIMFGDAKAGGILVESTTIGGALLAMIGIGVNLASAPAIEGRAVTSLVAQGYLPLTPRSLLVAIDRRLEVWCAIWQGGQGFAAVREAWLERAGSLGESMVITAGRDKVDGVFAGIDHTGALLLRDRMGRERRFTFGEIGLEDVTGNQGH